VRPDNQYTREYPTHMPAKITVRLKDGTVRTHAAQGFPGMPSQPFTWQDAVDKFDALADGRLDNSLSDEIQNAVRSLETIQTRDLTGLLARVPCPA
jgi:2-methylcitrate dehydratase